MKNPYSIKHTLAWILLALLSSVGGDSFSSDSTVAIGSVSSLGAVTKQANSVNGTVSASKPGTGHYVITVSTNGAFRNTTASDIAIQTGVIGSSTSDKIASSAVSTISDDNLSIVVRVSDAESSANPDSPNLADASFHFLIRRISGGSARVPAGSRFLHAAGEFQSNGTSVSSFSANGAVVETDQPGINGYYTIKISKPGAYADDSNEDYLVFVTGEEITTLDRVFVSVVDTPDDDYVTAFIRSADAQKAAASSNPSAATSSLYYSIYRITDEEKTGLPKSRMLAAMARVTGNNGAVANGGTSLSPGTTITGAKLDTGIYQVTLTSPGNFSGRNADEFVVLCSVSDSNNTDKVIRARVSIPNADELRVAATTLDIEEDGNDFGVRTDSNFFFMLYDLKTRHQPDLRIGAKKKVASMKGDNAINTSGAGQTVKVKIPGTSPKKFYYAVENDGNIVDGVHLMQKGVNRSFRMKHFRLSGGRRNVTAAVKRGTIAASSLRPGALVRFESAVKYRKPSDTPRLKILITGTSSRDTSSADTVRAKTVSLKR